MDVPYCIVKGKARLGQVVYQKTATALAFTAVKSEDQGAFAKIVDNVKSNFNDREDVNRRWGGGIMGAKSQERTRQKEKAVAREAAKRMQLKRACTRTDGLVAIIGGIALVCDT